MPWTARNAASEYIDHANVHSTDPIRKIEIAIMNSGLRPKMSDSLP